MKIIRITAKPAAGFRRCGKHHPAVAVDHPADTFNARQIAQLKAEPQLVVLEIDVPNAPAPKGNDSKPAADTTSGEKGSPQAEGVSGAGEPAKPKTKKNT